ncbi:MAG: saccharopine dehydrogenase NADP-binding domain-containing protein [Desulfobacterales bacterium]|nr:saccharopine dehydrogenase NADP-binding domain-containing protein [Desulfobacterales bacterium]
MERRVVLLGYGMQGKACVYDLIKHGDFSHLDIVDCYDGFLADVAALDHPRIQAHHMDGGDTVGLNALFSPASLVIDFFPPHFTLTMMELAIDAQCHAMTSSYINNPSYQDVPGFVQRVEALGVKARERGMTILQEFGMDPGMDLAVGQKVVDGLDEVVALHSYGAGFPEPAAANNPLRYKFTWSVIGTVRSHLRPARYLSEGENMEIPSDGMFAPEHTHYLKLPGLDESLECFYNGNSMEYISLFGIQDHVKTMGRYICRWPGHGAFWERMAKCGFLSSDPITVGDQQVHPDEFCAALLGDQPQFRYQKGERDIGLIRVDGRGIKDGKPLRIVMQTLVRHDLESGFSAMQQTVGFPMAIGAMMILDGKVRGPGMVMPMDVPLDDYFQALEKRGICFERTETPWDGKQRP